MEGIRGMAWVRSRDSTAGLDSLCLPYIKGASTEIIFGRSLASRECTETKSSERGEENRQYTVENDAINFKILLLTENVVITKFIVEEYIFGKFC